MYVFITILSIVLAVLLGAIVLIQNPKGGGLSGSFGGVGQQLLGARRSTDIVEKLTWGFAAGLLFFCLTTAFFVDKGKTSATQTLPKSEIEEQQMKNGFNGNLPQQNQGMGTQQPAQQPPAQ
ncbi:MAG: preprotein translocase subunit SecG [Chitinophagales bacterium]|nr:preprotein translocase subunit SecG [Chitinophagales bacterium]